VHRSQARAATNEEDRALADLSGAEDERTAPAAQDLSVSAAAPGDRAAEPGLVRRRDLHPDAARLPLPRGDHGPFDKLRRASRKVLAWRLSNTMEADFCVAALEEAIARYGGPDALLHHSDQGSQYTSEQFQRLMADNGVICSMSRSGNVWDNAAMESFFSSLKTERTARKMYRTRNEAKADVFDYIERFYNPKRRHSTIGYLSPMEFERQAGLA
jgi:transposase InsO family protein